MREKANMRGMIIRSTSRPGAKIDLPPVKP
jgi:hypothetical protein